MTAKVNPSWVQGHYRFRNDDGSLATATWKANQDTSASIDVDTTFRLRISWGESAGQTAGTASGTITIQYDINASGTWTTVGAATAVKYTTSSQGISDATADNNARLTLPTGVASFSAGEFDNNNSGSTRTPSDQGYEYEFCLQIDSAQVANNDSITFRLLYGGNVFGSVDAVPTATVVESGTTFDDDVTDTAAAAETVVNTAVFAESVTDTAAATDDATLPPVVFYVIYASAGSAPSAAQVKAGQDATGSAAVAHGHEVARTTTGEQVLSAATGLTAGTSYRVAFVWSDWTDDSNVAVSDAWSTTAAAIDESASDTAAATETITAALVIALSAADAADATETVAGALVVTESASDSAAATETVAVALVATDAVTDAAAGTDAATGSLVLPEAVADSAAGTDTAAAGLVAVDAVADSAAASDTAAGDTSKDEAVSDSAAATDAATASAVLAEAVSDAADGSDTVVSVATFAEAVSDSAASSESVSDSLGSVTYNESAEDTAAASETVASTAVLGDAVSDSAAGSETVASLATLGESVTDAAAATDATTDSLAGTAPVAEVRKRGGPTRPYRYSIRLGRDLVYADSPRALQSAIRAYEESLRAQAEKRARLLARERPGSSPKIITRKLPRVSVVEAPDGEVPEVRQQAKQANERIRDLYEMQMRVALIAANLELLDDEEALMAVLL